MILLAACSKHVENEVPFPIKPAPEFTGTDQDGNSFTTTVLHGKPWIASFFFTSCTTVCPVLNAEKQKLSNEFGSKVLFVSVSTDPETDTGAVLKSYADRLGAKTGSWWMINMPLAEVRSVSTLGFGLMDPQEPAMHSTRLVAVGANGTIQGYFDSTDSSEMRRLRQWINSQQ